MQDLEAIGLQAVDRFITTFNSRDVESWADSLHFPHVRPAPFGPIRVLDDKAHYVSTFDYGPIIESGWDHSEWDYKQFLHQSANKLHVAGQWSRYTATGEKILSTPIVYIVTKIDGRWGIQSRFSCDYSSDDDTTGFETRVFRHYETFVSHYNQGNREACAEMLNYPFYRIEPGQLNETSESAGFELSPNQIQVDALMAIQTGRKSMNLAVELTLEHDGQQLRRQGVINVTDRDNHLGIQAISLIDPDDTEEN